MRIDSMTVAGLNGIDVPEGTNVDDEFVITARVRVFSLEREKVDVTEYGGEPTSLPGELHADVVLIGRAEVSA